MAGVQMGTDGTGIRTVDAGMGSGWGHDVGKTWVGWDGDKIVLVLTLCG